MEGLPFIGQAEARPQLALQPLAHSQMAAALQMALRLPKPKNAAATQSLLLKLHWDKSDTGTPSKLLQESLTVVAYWIYNLFLFLNIIYVPVPCVEANLPSSTASLALDYCRPCSAFNITGKLPL